MRLFQSSAIGRTESAFPVFYQSAAQNRLFLCSVRPGLLSEMENNSLNVGRASMITGTSSGISPSSKWRMREQVRLTNSKSCVTIKMTFPISDSRRIRPATCVMLSKSSPLVGSSNTSRSFPQIMLTATATRCF